MLEKLKNAGWIVLGIAFMVVLGLLGMLFIYGGVWLGDKVYPWLVNISSIAFLTLIFILLPLTIFRKTRAFAGNGIVFASYVFGITLWVWGMLVTFELWGGFGLFIGLSIAGVGVVPLAMLATMFKGLWPIFWQLVVLLILTFGARFTGMFAISKVEN